MHAPTAIAAAAATGIETAEIATEIATCGVTDRETRGATDARAAISLRVINRDVVNRVTVLPAATAAVEAVGGAAAAGAMAASETTPVTV